MPSTSPLLAGFFAVALSLPATAQQTPTLIPAGPVLAPAAAPGVAATVDLPPAGSHAVTQSDVEAWLDGFLPYAIGRGEIPGAVVVVVKDGQILVSKG